MKICQSCGMPMEETGEMYGMNSDGSKNEEYCTYCYDKDNFTQDMSMNQMIEFCIPFMMQEVGMAEDDARKNMQETLPTLKRWA